MIRRGHALSKKIAIFISIAFAILAVVNGLVIYWNFSDILMREIMANYLRDEMLEYEALPWLFTYWESHYADMDIPANALSDEDWLSRHSDYLTTDLKGVSEAEAASLQDGKQQEFAEICYVRIAVLFQAVTRRDSAQEVECAMFLKNKEIFDFFDLNFHTSS